MGVIKWVYGILTVLAALDAMLFGLVPPSALSVIVIILGVLILFTSMGSPYAPATFSQNIRRWVLGIAMIIIGIASGGLLGSLFNINNISIFGYLALDTFVGQIILLLIGVIYLFAGTKTGNRAIYS